MRAITKYRFLLILFRVVIHHVFTWSLKNLQNKIYLTVILYFSIETVVFNFDAKYENIA